jgi:hypothetical protein
VIAQSTAAEFPIYAFNLSSDGGRGRRNAYFLWSNQSVGERTIDDMFPEPPSLSLIFPLLAQVGSVSRSSLSVPFPDASMFLHSSGATEYGLLYFAGLDATIHCQFTFRSGRQYYLGGGVFGKGVLKLNPDTPAIRAGTIESGEVRATVSNQAIYTAGKEWEDIYIDLETRDVWGSVVDPPPVFYGSGNRSHLVSFVIPYQPPGLNGWLNLVSYVDFGGVRMSVLRSDVEAQSRHMVLTAGYEVI